MENIERMGQTEIVVVCEFGEEIGVIVDVRND